jgi:hypothetical protein
VKDLSFASLLAGGPLESFSLDTTLQYCVEDRERFVSEVQQGRLSFVLDRFGQVAVLDQGRKLVAMFIAFRDRAAAWLPDGTRQGSPALSLGPATPDAARKIGEALLNAG